MTGTYPEIPYGWADFEAMRREGCLYVDKTRFLHELENERYVVLIRPRRFGKSCWVSLLENYYDRRRADRFAELFAGTDVGRHPTPNRHRYVILRFDFSAFDDTLETLRERFEYYCFQNLRYALETNADLFTPAAVRRILAAPSIDTKLNELFLHTREHDIPLYVLIDEYDNFANTVLAHRGAEAYESFTHGGGFYRNFFATLKAGAGQGGGVERLFVTGHLPGAVSAAVQRHAPRVRDRAQVPQAERIGWRGASRGGRAGSADTTATVPGGRTLDAPVPDGALHRPGGGVPWLEAGALRRCSGRPVLTAPAGGATPSSRPSVR